MCVARRNRLSTYEVKAVSHQNDSVPGGDASPDEAQQDQGIVERVGRVSGQSVQRASINRPQLGFNLLQFAFHWESPATVTWCCRLESRECIKCSGGKNSIPVACYLFLLLCDF